MFEESNCVNKDDPNFSTKNSFCARCPIRPIPESVKLIRSDIGQLIVESYFGLIPKFVRLGFHDCVDRCDGCVDLNNEFNNGLDVPIEMLNSTVQKYTVDQYTELSRADIWALAALTAANMSQSTIEFPYAWVGRVDCKGNYTIGPVRKMPSTDWNTTQVLDYFQLHFGFNERQTVAIMGGHNLGSAHLEFSDFNGSWVKSNLNLTKSYYNNLVNQGWNQRKNSKQKWQWELAGHEGLMMLNSDVALVRDFEVDEVNDPGKVSCKFQVSSNVVCPFF